MNEGIIVIAELVLEENPAGAEEAPAAPGVQEGS